MKILNGVKLILDDQGNYLDSSTIILESFRSFRGPLFYKLVTGQELFLAVSYSKLALVHQVINWQRSVRRALRTLVTAISKAFKK